MDATGARITEYKFAGMPPGEFEGYGAVFGNVDSHGDIIQPGAFAEHLRDRQSQGRTTMPMHAMHAMAGDGLPVGVWKGLAEDHYGLRVHGKVSGMDTQQGRLHYERLRDGAYGGLSIGYHVPRGGSHEPTSAEKAKGARRILTKVQVHEISLVDEPSNALCKFDGAYKTKALEAMKSRAYAELARQERSVDRDDVAVLLGIDRVMERAALMKAHPAAAALFERDLRQARDAMDGLPVFPYGHGPMRGVYQVLAELVAFSDRMGA